MKIYSESTQTFLKKIHILAREIIQNEVGLNYSNKRILFNNTYFPINFVCFESSKMLGYYDPIIYQIGINKSLMIQINEDILKNILRHEIAHFLCYLYFKNDFKDHGVEFREIFKRYNWDQDFSKSKVMIDNIVPLKEKEKSLLEKVDKLLRLSESTNIHEANLALKKANELITLHNLEFLKERNEQGNYDETYVEQIFFFTKKNALHDGIYHVLENLNVYPVFNQGKGGGYLEVIGPKLNVTLATYIAHHLEKSIEQIWQMTKSENHSLKGIAAKNSFISSFCKEVCDNLKKEKIVHNKHSTNHTENSNSLILSSKELSLHVERVYPRLRKSHSKASLKDPLASKLGSEQGKSFKIKKGLSDKSSPSKFLPF